MGAEDKEHLLNDLEAGVSTPSRSSCTSVFCLPPLALLRRKKVLGLILLIPIIYFTILYDGITSSSLDYKSAQDAGAHMLESLQSSLHQAAPAINELAGKIPGLSHHYDDAHLDKEGHLHNALLDKLHIEGTAELEAFKNKVEHDPAAVAAAAKLESSSNVDLSLQLEEMTKFTPNDESVLLLLLALKDEKFIIKDDWKGVFFDRTPLGDGLLAALKAGPSNKFTELLARVGLPKAAPTDDTTKPTPRFSFLDDAYQRYALSRADWVEKAREALGLTVFSKSYCPYSKKAKALLTSLNANYTVYEVDLRPDAHNLQSLLAELTGHKTFPTVLAKDKLLGGNDDVQQLHSLGALKSILQSVGAL